MPAKRSLTLPAYPSDRSLSTGGLGPWLPVLQRLGASAHLNAPVALRTNNETSSIWLRPMASRWSYASVRSVLSLLSFASILSIASAGSILSIGSAGSILSIGSAGSIGSIGASGGRFSFRKRPATGGESD